jgi:hypothetical protein
MTRDARPTGAQDDTATVEAIAAICDEFEAYGWRRVRAELRHRGMVDNLTSAGARCDRKPHE